VLKLPTKLFEREPLRKIPARYAQAVGQVIVAHSRLELYATELVYELLCSAYTLGRQLLRGDNPVETFKIAQRLLGAWGSSIQITSAPTQLSKRIETAYTKRNAIAHGVWVRLKGNDYRLRRVREKRTTDVGELDRRIMPQFAKVTLKQLKKDAQFINAVGSEIQKLIKEVRDSLKAWPKTDPSRAPQHPGSRRGRRKKQDARHQPAT
jgi:hypothetical protein